MSMPMVGPRIRSVITFAAAVCLALTTVSSVHAQVWSEVGDAGDLVATAQGTTGLGSLTTITGSLASATDVDLYCIRLSAVPPAGLPLIQLQCVVQQGPNVWLFDAFGNGVFTSSGCSMGNKTILAPNVSLAAGTYYVAVSYSGVDPQSAAGAIWNPTGSGQRAPDGPGAAGTLTGWAGTPTVQPMNPYQITLTYMAYCQAPTPSLRPTWGRLKSFYR